MRESKVRRAAPVVAVLAIAVLAGCDGTSNGTTTAAPSASAAATGAGGATGIAGVVTAEQARAALVSADDLPDGWTADASSDPTQRRTTYDPRACSVLSAPVERSSVLARAGYSLSGQFAANLTQQIYVPAGTAPTATLTDLRSLLTTCASYQVTTSSGTSTIKVSTLPFPALGDATLAVRTEANGALIPVVDTGVYIATGGQIIRFDSISTGTGLADKDLQKLAELAYERLRKS